MRTPSPGQQPTRVSVLTAEGRGAIAVVRLWGPGALRIASSAFRAHRGRTLDQTPVGRLRVGRLGDGLGDEVVAVVLAPDEVEIHCHGGPAAVALVVGALTDRGAQRAEPREWLAQACRTTLEAEAALDLPRATTARTAEILLDQLQGALATEIQRLLAQAATDPASIIDELDRLIAHAEVGTRLIRGWTVVLAGRPNVGKSALLNALAGFERAIVDPTPGTTRDVVRLRTAIDGWPVELADTAGLRLADDPIEASGVAVAQSQQQQADLVLLVLDRSEPLTRLDLDLLATHLSAVVVASKADLPPAWEPTSPKVITLSSVTGTGLETLMATVSRRLVAHPPSSGAAVPFQERHRNLLHDARAAFLAEERLAGLSALRRLLEEDRMSLDDEHPPIIPG